MPSDYNAVDDDGRMAAILWNCRLGIVHHGLFLSTLIVQILRINSLNELMYRHEDRGFSCRLAKDENGKPVHLAS